MESSINKKLKALENAINYEIDEHYVNAIGKKTTFSNFIIKNTQTLALEIHDKSRLKSLINLFYAYETQDLNQRMETIHKAQDILRIISKEHKEKKTTEQSFKERHRETNLKKIDIQYIKGVGPKLALVLNKLGIFTANDLLYYFPRTYIDYKNCLQIRDIKDGENVIVLGKVKTISYFDPPKKKGLSIITLSVIDESGKITITKFFSRQYGRVMYAQYKKTYPQGSNVMCTGTVTYDKYNRSFSLANSSIEVIDQKDLSIKGTKTVPVYSLTETLSNDQIKKIVFNCLNSYSHLVEESLPKELIAELKLLDLKTSLKEIHDPSTNELCKIARDRLVFEEFFFLQLHLAYRRNLHDKNRTGLALKESKNSLVNQLIKTLPFELTNAQNKAFNEIKKDLMSEKPMHRLLQGDVGSGKTIVSLLALLFAIENGYQVALMAPTEILCHQHALKFQEYLNPLGIRVAELTSSTPTKFKKEIYENLANGSIKIVVGTHALIQKEVLFKNLGFVTIDEQHRFGVKQRDELLKKGENVERLFMTATPIPRSLALAIHGDLELSEIDELPPGRIPIKTYIVQPSKRNKAFDLIKGEIAKGQQAYIVFPLIEESEALSAKAATIEFEELSKTIFKDYKLGLMHGELTALEKENIMNQFKKNEINILITTTVIEVGVDIPNATVMMIENAERFGLSQLHQLRGRIGRGGKQGFCILIPQSYSEDSNKRLQIMSKTNNGFLISQEDLKIRGPGDFLGTKQSGLPNLRLADIIQDAETLETARSKALQIIKLDPTLDNHPELKKSLTEKENSYLEAG